MPVRLLSIITYYYYVLCIHTLIDFSGKLLPMLHNFIISNFNRKFSIIFDGLNTLFLAGTPRLHFIFGRVFRLDVSF